MQRLNLLISCGVASATLVSSLVFSQEPAGTYPSRPVTIIVSAAPGGSFDSEFRRYAIKLTEFMGQQFTLDFKPGGGTSIGGAYVAKSKPDGYTLLAVSTGFTIYPALYKDLTFDTIRDFTPVSLISQAPFVMVVYPAFPVKTFADYLAYAKANPGKINYGMAGVGGTGHLVGAWIHSLTNTKVTFVNYKGEGPRILDLVAGRLDIVPVTLQASLLLVKSGKARALAITDDKRSKLMPDVPTVAEQGIPGFLYTNWSGIVIPAATPAAIVSKLNTELVKVAKAPDVAGPMEADGSIMVGSTPARFRQIIVTETERWRKVIQENGIQSEQ